MDLLERDHELAVLRGALTRARSGQGAGVAVCADAGLGKSVLLAAACATVPGLRMLHGSCDPLRTPRPLGPFRDLAGEAGLTPLMRDEDASLSRVCEAWYDALRTQATALVVEDLHWVDAATVDVLRFLVRRLDAMPLALLLSYRDHEIGPGHSARQILGDFARLDGLATVALRPLSAAAVGQLVRGTPLEGDRVHQLTGGNPFFVTEVAKEPELPLPASVRDAVLARTAHVAPGDVEVLQLMAAAPDRLDDRVLPALGVDLPTLRRLDATGLLSRDRGGLGFRHELARHALESTIPPGGLLALHDRLLHALERLERPDPAVLTHHAVAAGDRARAARYAQAAAADAIRAGSHSEAAAFFRTALDHLDGALPQQTADLLQRLSFEQYMTSRLPQAITNVRSSFGLWQRAGDHARLSGAHETCAIFEYYSARRQEAEAHADQAAVFAQQAGSGPAYAAARATRGYLAYMRSDLDLARHCCDDAARGAAEPAHSPLALRVEVIRAVTDSVSGSLQARVRLAAHIETARAHGWDELASTGYSHLVSHDVEHRRFRAAERVLEESLPLTVDRDIPICQYWQTAVRCRLRFSQGRWSAALEDARYVLGEKGMPLARLWPHLVTALVALRRGEEGGDSELEAAWELAQQIDEPLRTLPVLSALCERMWLTGQSDPRVLHDAGDALERCTGAPGLEWATGDLASWLRRLGLLTRLPSAVTEPFRAAFAGRPGDASSWWRRSGDPFAEAMALADSSADRDRYRAVELADQLGATATADRVRAALRADGVQQVPARPRASTRNNPAGLTNRQLDVARLVARGLTNAEIAARLYIAPKTADHHVSAVLMKMGLPSRRSVVVQADELGLA